MKWYCAIFSDAKTHCFPECLKEALLANLAARDCHLLEDFPGGALQVTTEIGLSLLQPCPLDIAYVNHELPGVTFSTEARELEYFLNELKQSGERLELGIPYYKIHGRLHCVCLIPEHRELLMRSMEAKLPEATAIADLENQQFNEVMANASKHVHVSITPRPVGEIGKA